MEISCAYSIFLENEACDINPCAPGICSVNDEGRFQCDCEGTFHTGERCETSFLQIPSIPVLTTNTDYDVSITSSPQIEQELTLTVTNISALNIVGEETQKLIPADDSTTVVYTLHPNEPGLFQVRYNIEPKNNFRKPENSVVLITSSGSSGKKDNNYFQSLGLSDGQLGLGCCSNSLFMSSAQCISKLSFFSSCQWFSPEGETEFISKGVVFIGGRTLNLPLSIAGIDVQSSSSSFKASLPTTSDILSERCFSCERETFQCTETNTTIRFNENDVQNFLTFNSLSTTFLESIKDLLPSWLSVSIHSSISAYSNYDFLSFVGTSTEIKNLEGCESYQADAKKGLLYALRTKSTLYVVIDNFPAFLHSSTSKPVCILVDMCSSFQSKLYFMVPSVLQPSQLTGLPYFQILTNKGQVSFQTITFTERGNYVRFKDSKYWRGDTYFTAEIPKFEFEVEMKLEKEFVGNYLGVNIDFVGSAMHQSQPDEGKVSLLIP